ncbi:MAG: hypothetical protein ACI3ZT_04575 [Candidatus Cryptobacteroides sp.]
MKRLVTMLVCIAGFAVAGAAADKDFSKGFIVQGGYGYSLYKHDCAWDKSGGFTMMQSFLYSPHRHWAFGVNVGYERTTADKRYSASQLQSLDVVEENVSVGPMALWLPVRTGRHQLYVGAGVNYLKTFRDIHSVWSSEEAGKVLKDGSSSKLNRAGGLVTAGYTYSLTRDIGIGPKLAVSFSDGVHYSALVNLSFSF